jgi:hypothetical protein
VSRGLADVSRPGRNQELHRIAKWESQHLIENGGDLGLIGLWLRAVGAPAPEPIAPPEGEQPLKPGVAGRLVLALGPGDVPQKSEDIRIASRAAGACGGWAALRGALDALDWTTPDGRRALRAAVGSRNARALQSRRAWNQLRPKCPRLPAAEDVGIGDSGKGKSGGDDSAASRKRRRRRRKMSTADVANGATPTSNGDATVSTDGASAATPSSDATAPAAGDAASPSARKRRRRRRRKAAGASAPEAPAAE